MTKDYIFDDCHFVTACEKAGILADLASLEKARKKWQKTSPAFETQNDARLWYNTKTGKFYCSQGYRWKNWRFTGPDDPNTYWLELGFHYATSYFPLTNNKVWHWLVLRLKK